MTDIPLETADRPPEPWAVRRATIIRLATGLIQGLLLYGLYQADQSRVWPATQREVYAAFLMIVLFVPFVGLAGISALRLRTLAAWKAVAAIIAAGLGAYGVWSGDPAAQGVNGLGPLTFLSVGALIFIGHHLVQPADMERRRIARFATYFDVTWKHGVQAVLSLGFTGAFWLLLFLASALFKLIGVDAIEKLIQRQWFIFPATALMFAAAVQLTDVQANLVRGVRTVALTLLAWLLPLMALIAVGFLLTLPFTGLEPLWKTRSATAILLTADAFLILLTNAAYQDGTEKTAVVLKWAARLAGVLLVPITVLAAYGLSLRIGQYGLSPDRIIAGACVLVAAGYAVGYTAAAVQPGTWMKALEPTNIAMAFVVIVVLLALGTPLADPRRLSVNDQIGRLESGKVKVEAFDYQFLRFDAGRFGRETLDRLKTNSNVEIAKRAKRTAAQTGRFYDVDPDNPAPPSQITFHPKGAQRPEGFPGPVKDFPNFEGCLAAGAVCDGRMLDVTGDGRPEVLLSSGGAIEVWGNDPNGHWGKLGSFQACGGLDTRAAIRDGKLSTAEPTVQDLVSPGDRMDFVRDVAPCPPRDKP